MNILFATSDAALASALTGALIAAGHSVTTVTEAAAFADTWAQSEHVALVIVDDMAQPDLLEALRAALDQHAARSDAERTSIRVLVLSTPPHMSTGNLDRTPEMKRRTPTPTIRRNVSTSSTAAPNQTRTSAQITGTSREAPSLPHADAVIVKPFSDAELLSHIHALVAQSDTSHLSDNNDNPRMLIHGDLMLDTLHSQAFYRGSQQPLALSTREYLTLETLIRANGEFLTFDELLAKVCGTGFFEQRDVMDGVLYSLTRKMRRLGFFITQRGHKYRIR